VKTLGPLSFSRWTSLAPNLIQRSKNKSVSLLPGWLIYKLFTAFTHLHWVRCRRSSRFNTVLSDLTNSKKKKQNVKVSCWWLLPLSSVLLAVFPVFSVSVLPGAKSAWSVRQCGVNLCHGRLRVQNDFGMTQLMPRLNSDEEQHRTLSSRNCTLIMWWDFLFPQCYVNPMIRLCSPNCT